MTIGSRPTPADRPHRVTIENVGDPVPDGEGGYTESWTPATPPTLYVSIQPASTRNLEQVTSSATILATATHVIKGPYHPQVEEESRLTFLDHGRLRIFHVESVQRVDELSASMVVVATERL
jgi:head-tail adaptor